MVMNWIEVNGVGLRYELAGSGAQTVLLVHELGGSLDSWDATLPAFQNRAHAGDHMVLSLDPGKQVCFEATQVFNQGRIGIHELLSGLERVDWSHRRTA